MAKNTKYGNPDDILNNIIINKQNEEYIRNIFKYPEYGNGFFNRGIKYEVNPDLDETILDPVLNIAKDKCDIYNNLIITFINFKYIDKALLRIDEFKKLNITNYLIFCMDKQSYDQLKDSGSNVAYFPINLNLPTPGIPQKLGRFIHLQKRHFMIYYLLKNGLNVLSFDADAVWLKNPFNIFKKYEDVHIFITQEYTNVPSLIFRDIKYTVRGGFFYIKAHPTTITLFYNSYKIARMFICAQYSLTTLLYLGGDLKIPDDISYYIKMRGHGNYQIKLTDSEFITYFEDVKVLILPQKSFPRFHMDDKIFEPYIVDPLPCIYQIKYVAKNNIYTLLANNAPIRCLTQKYEYSYFNNFL